MAAVNDELIARAEDFTSMATANDSQDGLTVSAGQGFPLGSVCQANGVNFSVYSQNATAVELLLFDRVDDALPTRTIPLHPATHRTYYYWHVFIRGLKAGQIYGYRVTGPSEPERGHRFDASKVLLDPYGKSVLVPPNYSRRAASQPGDNTASAMKSVVVDSSPFDWQGDAPLHHRWASTVIYEMHVGGFTRHPSSGVAPAQRGTYRGLIEKIPYLRSLGVTAVELMPVFQFDEQAAPAGMKNYWGYQPVSFFAPHSGYSVHQDGLGPLDEFREMIKALHRAGLEVILDVVYNHTAEGGADGPTICFRGFDNEEYYILQEDRARYADYTGTGNTLNANHPIVRRMILDSLRYWVQEMHVDGFRFDLASILSRDEMGHPMNNPPVIWDIETDPVLAGTKLIAEAWDAGGLYQVGNFVGNAWKEWNGKFRDDIRSFIKGDEGTVTKLAHRLTASPDVYGLEKWQQNRSINFVTCHDGFTLNDLVSYNVKHNESNGEENRDGTNDNLSWNCGVEGATDDPEVEALRNRQVKNFLTLILLAQGTPMLLMGDEGRRTQHGNNNVYCHDDETSWFDWTLVERHRDVRRFVERLIAHRLNLIAKRPWPDQHTLTDFLRAARVRIHGLKIDQPDWGDNSHTLAFTALGEAGAMLHFMINAYWQPLAFELLPRDGGDGVRRWIDTSLPSPNDICDLHEAPLMAGSTYLVQPRSIVCLVSQPRAANAS
ncbi:MAG TPA: glycogen debranching protein GlgX [Pyrinomonadaceae bacterium]|nr:glycogen debranching protein GlgX [Pyrinomonadaceae bacterium]